MAIDFLGKETPKNIKKTVAPVIMHQPAKEKVLPPNQPKKVEAPKPVLTSPKEELGEVNLMSSFKKYLFKKRITIIIFALLVILIIFGVVLYFATRPPKIVINENLNLLPVNNNLPVALAVCGNALIEQGEQCDVTGCTADQICENCLCQTIVPPAPICGNALIEQGEQCDLSVCPMGQTCENCQCQAIIPPSPVCGNGIIETGEECDSISLVGCGADQTCVSCKCQTVILPDTVLAPLRGALVKFNDSSSVYLIDWHGELRKVDPISVYFKEGQNVNQLKNRIYALNQRYEDTRQGKEVKGYVDWDPRVLSEVELQPYK